MYLYIFILPEKQQNKKVTHSTEHLTNYNMLRANMLLYAATIQIVSDQ